MRHQDTNLKKYLFLIQDPKQRLQREIAVIYLMSGELLPMLYLANRQNHSRV